MLQLRLLMYLCCICSFADTTFHEDTEACVGESVTLHCTSPIVSPTSVTWHRRYNSASGGSVLWRIDGDQMSQVDTSGRLSLKKTASTEFDLVIHDALRNDSGTYVCSVDAGHEKQHVTVLNIKGIKSTATLAVGTILISVFTCFQSAFVYLSLSNQRIYTTQVIKRKVYSYVNRYYFISLDVCKSNNKLYI